MKKLYLVTTCKPWSSRSLAHFCCFSLLNHKIINMINKIGLKTPLFKDNIEIGARKIIKMT